MKRLLILIFCLFAAGCMATKLLILEHDKTGKVIRTIEAEDYSIKTPTLTAVPSRWLTPAFVGEIIRGALAYASIPSIPIAPTPNPAPAPVPTPVPAPVPVPTPYPAPVPTPIPVPVPPQPVPTASIFTRNGNVLTMDMDSLPGHMEKAGFPGSANALWYCAAYVYAYGPGAQMPDDEANSLAPLNTPEARQRVFNWLDAEVLKVRAMMLADPKLTLVAISNDGPDKVGFRLGPPILERLKEFGGRISLGEVYVCTSKDRKK